MVESGFRTRMAFAAVHRVRGAERVVVVERPAMALARSPGGFFAAELVRRLILASGSGPPRPPPYRRRRHRRRPGRKAGGALASTHLASTDWVGEARTDGRVVLVV